MRLVLQGRSGDWWTAAFVGIVGIVYGLFSRVEAVIGGRLCL